jgi:hypothetical protein
MKDPADGNSVFIEAMDLELGSSDSKKMQLHRVSRLRAEALAPPPPL